MANAKAAVKANAKNDKTRPTAEHQEQLKKFSATPQVSVEKEAADHPPRETPNRKNFKNYPSLAGARESSAAPSQAAPATQVADAAVAPAQAQPTPSNGVRMPAINDVRLAGRLTRDPVIREVGNQKVANFDLAVEKLYRDAKNEWQKQVSYVPCAVWGAVADRARGFLHKGSPVYLEGRLRSQSWQTKDGQKRSIMRLEAYKVQSLARSQNKTQGQEIGE